MHGRIKEQIEANADIMVRLASKLPDGCGAVRVQFLHGRVQEVRAEATVERVTRRKDQ